jgi:Tol biopolymer transport system component
MYKLILLLFACLLLGSTPPQEDPCTIIDIVKSKTEALNWNKDSTLFLVNKKDSAGIYQVFVGSKNDPKLKCVSHNGPASGKKPWAKRNKMQVLWHPSGQWIICAVEKEKFNEEWLKGTKGGRKLLEGWLQCGLWMDIWAVKPDGTQWSLLATTVRGMTGPAFTPDGKRCVWAEALDSANMIKDKFGKWRLMLSEFAVDSTGTPHFTSSKNITPKGAVWVEPGNFSPDGRSVLLSADIGMEDARGQDQYILNIETGEVKNLTNTPKVWDEHGLFSPDGKKVLFMSSYPYRSDKNSYKIVGIKTEFMLMNTDGSGLQQLTHFRTKGYPESSDGMAATAFFSADGKTIYATTLIFPAYENFIIHLKGPCGNQGN